MLEALQGQIKGNSIILNDDLLPFDGRTVTIIINEPIKFVKPQHAYKANANGKPIKRSVDEINSCLSMIENDELVIPTSLEADDYVRELRANDRI